MASWNELHQHLDIKLEKLQRYSNQNSVSFEIPPPFFFPSK